MGPQRTVRWTFSAHGTLRAAKNSLKRAKKGYMLSHPLWRIVKEEEVEWWPR
jgi:hypothetical protein